MTLTPEHDAAVRAIVAKMLAQALGGADARIRDHLYAVAKPSPATVRLECLRLAAASYDPIEGRAAEARKLTEAAAVFAEFVLGASHA
jgi:hypothetical protein